MTTEKEQYLLGRQAGEILKKIHGIKVDENAIIYARNNIHKIWSIEPSYLHGDFHPGNFIYMDDGSIGVIDFNRWEVGAPYEEIYKHLIA